MSGGSSVVPEALEAALERVMALEKLTVTNALSQALALHQSYIQTQAAQIYAEKELSVAETGEGVETVPSVSEKEQLAMEIDELHDCLLNHKLARFSLQEAAIRVQMQEAVSSSMAEMDLAEPVDNLPQKEAMITHLNNNASSCQELAAVIDKKQDVDLEILELRLKYCSLVDDVRQKWSAIKSGHTQGHTLTTEEKELGLKLQSRESKLQLLVAMLQGLISNSGIPWGRYQYFIVLLKLCDSITRSGSAAEQDKMIDSLPKLREMLQKSRTDDDDDEDDDRGGAERNLKKMKFFTSTPRQNK